MKRILILSAVGLLSLTAAARAGGLGACLNCGIHCINPPPPPCDDCCGPCPRHTWTICGPEHAHCIMESLLHGDCCCERIKAARKLGCRLHADFCADPEVLTALLHALLCDPCWEVRREAAWSIALQGARVEPAILALYLTSKLDPHYLVRDKAADALDVLLVCRRPCYTDLFLAADAVVKQLRGKYKPGSPDCISICKHCCAMAAGPAPVVVPAPAALPAERLPVAPAPMPSAK